jgi:lipopolysaccharide export system protein LptC
LDSTITSEHTEHKPENDSSVMHEPRFQLYAEGLPDWHVSAQTGELFDHGKEVVLNQRVVVLSADQQTSLKTPQLRIFPNKKTAYTDKPVTLLNANGFTRSIGLEADFNKKIIVLLSHVKGQYNPKVTSDNVE